MIDSPRPRVRTPYRSPRESRRRRLRASVSQNRSRVPDLSGGRLLLPSALTVLAICAGLSAAKFALDDRIDLAVGMIAAAALLDGVDGRIARLLGATTRIGAELDSLADAINFGVAPALTIYLVLLRGEDSGWVLALIYTCAIVLRLARFNTLLDDTSAPKFTKDFFVGVPAPAAALIALLPIAAEQQFGYGWWTSAAAVGSWMMLTAALAVSRIPTASLKSFAIPPRALVGLLILVAVGAALLVTFPYILMFVAILGYLLHIPFAWRSRRWVEKRPEEWDTPPRERRLERRARRQVTRTRPRKSEARLGLRRPERR
ncbi:CDP-alcohol phosphatidyltransferase family protein [Williamsia maris]|uniref:CDP-diacylglycerol---serine O-phosphatidyltransferase n=1 Tax=Williamsia maris TaxID=72806 RepID=A0ABT1HAR6_9NOCA|nr:phosphatidylcholine/phosphatidylserine synthase [Williamsia maris]MCP2175334.1 CDP-diacylglycerol---serine O-phosphatidyltransferase [Williamsia maris]